MTDGSIEEDISKIQNLVSKVLNNNNEFYFERMGGLTNHSYKITLDNNASYAIRLPGYGTEGMINRKDEYISTKLACDLGIDAHLLYFGQDGSKVTEYISNAITMDASSMQKDDNLLSSANIFRKLHNSKIDTKVPFEVFEIAKIYEDIINSNNVSTFDDYKETKEKVMKIKTEIDKKYKPKKVPCHNDPLCENWVMGKDKLYLIDWEYAGMNDALWDLADVSIEANYTEEQDDLYLRTLNCLRQ